MYSDYLYPLALTLVPGIGCVQARLLLQHFGDAASVFKAKRNHLEPLEGIGETRATQLLQFNDFKAAEAELAFLEKHHIQPLFFTDAAYPQRLLRCYDAPVMLYYRGNANLNNERIVSIIGTRTNSDYGRQATEQIISDLQAHHVLIVSGLAFGIDAIAHKTCLQQQIPTVGVMAHGFHTIYPAQHKNMAKDMLLHGGLLTEFVSGTKADKHNFPRRNRIVAGMADATIVIETAVKGGSMITAELAHNYNRDLFALPGRITDAKSSGCLKLVQQGKARVFTGTQQLLETMNWQDRKKPPKKQRELFVTLSPEEQMIVQLLQQKDSVHIDELFLQSGLTSSAVAGAILNLELQNLITGLPGKMYRLQ
jgi:DNA processing protein